MFLRQRRSVVGPVIILVVLALVRAQAAILSPQSADVFAQKIELIRDQKGRAGTQRTPLTEDEFNSWFVYRGQKMLPAGVAKPQLTIVGEGQLAAQAVVDLDAVARRRSRGGSSFDPLSLIGGTVPVTVSGLLHTRGGKARFEVQSAAISGIPVPVTVLQELVGYYCRTPERPEGVRLDETFTLPSGIQQVEIGRGQAVVVQYQSPRPLRDDFLSTPLQFLKGVGPRKAADLKRAGLVSVEDLLYRLPFRYEDRARMQPIASLRAGNKAAVIGEIKSARLAMTRRRGFKIFNAVVGDASGAIRCTWMNQAFLADILQPHLRVIIFGDVKLDSTGLHLLNPEYELVAEDGLGVHTGRIVPFYEKSGSVTPNMQRKLVRFALDQLPPEIPDVLPVDIRERQGLVTRRAAVEAAHFPPNDASVSELNAFRTPAQRRLIFEEFFLFQIGHAWRRQVSSMEFKPFVPTVDDRIRAAAAGILPFKLTPGQRQAVKEIVDDMRRPQPMHRLLQGDVGAGKTIVALLAALVAMENGLQVAFMAPTEILAGQHFGNIARLLSRSRFRVDLLTGSTPGLQKHTLHAHIERGTSNLIVGTHALVQENVNFHRLGLVVIDEQHRFGVAQRASLRSKGLQPDVLLMTATPIPRTLALTDYSELDISKITDLPPGRTPVRTVVRPESRRDEIYQLLREQLDRGRQAYIIYPLVEGSEKVDLKSATEMADHLQTDIFPSYRVALLHGRMKPDAKERVMHSFAAGHIHLLVSTTVVEVGVDVPNASVMVIEHAERFGLSQLHQLRGRVGRGSWESHCVLLYQSPWTDDARERLNAMAATNDGFVIAERDLELRGPGDFFGTRQSGLPQLRTGDLVRDRDIMEAAYGEARRLVAEAGLTGDLLRFVEEQWQQQFGLIEVG